MDWRIYSFHFCFALMNVAVSKQVCLVERFVTVPPTQYDTDYSSIEEIGKRPLGFQKGTWFYNDPAKRQLCIEVNNTRNRMIELMVQTSPPARICIQQKEIKRCGQETIHSCAPAQDNDLNTIYEFNCDARCSESDVNFWYRFVVSEEEATEGSDLQDWCSSRNTDAFPESLFTLDNLPPPPSKKNPGTGNASKQIVSIFLIGLISVFAYILELMN